jgi:dipeptidyl aminopeptidase/acylaminoacyl peptidase
MPKPKLLLPALVLAALLAFPAAAGATLSFTRGTLHRAVFVAADDGSGAHKVAEGSSPKVSPDGLSIAFLHEGTKHAQELQVVLAAGGPARTLMVGFREPFYLAWSPDSSTIAALRGPELGRRKLVLIDVATGAQRVVAQGFFSGFSFSPDGSELVYSRAGSEKYPPRSDVFRVQFVPPGAVSVAAEKPVRLTNDHRSLDPLWGPNNQIVFVKQLEAKKRKYGPKNELFLINPQGKGVKRLTHTKVDPLLQGLFPTDWSADGRRILAEFEGQDTSYAVGVNATTGAQRPIGKAGEVGFVGSALSRDGRFVLGYTGGFDPASKHDVVSIPYGGGKATLLVKNAFEPDWGFIKVVALSG